MYIDEQLPISEYGYLLWRDHRGRERRVVGFYMWQIGGFFLGTPVSSTNRTDRYDIAERLLKVAWNTIATTNIRIWLF